MMAMLVLMIVVGGIFGVIDVVNQRSSTEQAKLDMFQEAREFMDQMSRDLHQAGYPNPRHYLKDGVLTASPVINDESNAVGVVKCGSEISGLREMWTARESYPLSDTIWTPVRPTVVPACDEANCLKLTVTLLMVKRPRIIRFRFRAFKTPIYSPHFRVERRVSPSPFR